MTTPGYHRGRRAPNKGKSLPAERLSRAEVEAVFSGFPPTARKTHPRNRAILALLYHLDLKIGEIVLLERRHLDQDIAVLTVPATQLRKKSRRVQLDPVSERLLADWVRIRDELELSVISPLFCALQGVDGTRSGTPLNSAYIRRFIRDVAANAGIKKRVSTEGLRLSGRLHRQQLVFGSEDWAQPVLMHAELARTYPEAFDHWQAARDLFNASRNQHATRIGFECREAMAVFSKQLLRNHGLELEPRCGTVDRLRAVIRSHPVPSDAHRAHLEALVRLWGTTSDLAQRQTHGAEREGEPLKRRDAGRLLFHTLTLMAEVHLALSCATSAVRGAEDPIELCATEHVRRHPRRNGPTTIPT